MSTPCLESQGCHLIPLCYFFSMSPTPPTPSFCFFCKRLGLTRDGAPYMSIIIIIDIIMVASATACTTEQDIINTWSTNRMKLSCLIVQCSPYCSPREAGDICCLLPVWNLRAVIWFYFTISSLVLLSSPIALSVLSFFLPAGPFSWPFSQEKFSVFFVKR